MSQTKPVVVAITPNPAIDVTITVDELIDGATHRIDAAQKRLGGKGVNVGAVAAAQGYDSILMGPADQATLAAFAGDAMNLPAQARPAFTVTPTPMRQTWAIHQVNDNNTVIINEKGGSQPESLWADMGSSLTDELKRAPGSVVTISGSWPPGDQQRALETLLKAAAEGDAKATIVDCAGDNLLLACAHGAIVKPNAAELAETTGLDDPIDGVKQLLDTGALLVVASLGEEGLIAANAETIVRAKLPVPLEGNPTGCGDALVAALATSIIDDLTLGELITRCVAWSAAAVLVPYAGAIDETWPELARQVETSTLS